MEELELEEIKTLIERRTKVLMDGISMIEEELTSLKTNVNIIQYIMIVSLILIALVLASL
jgi:hypothetical protein